MRRYDFLEKEAVFEALNNLRNAFLAAKDGNEVEEIIRAILTDDERMKIGRRIEISYLLSRGVRYEDIIQEMSVGKSTITWVERKMDKYPTGFKLIDKREEIVKKEYQDRGFQKSGGSLQVFKKTKKTGFSRKDVRR